MTDEPLCSCGTELRVIKGGLVACLDHCDRPHPLGHCEPCIQYDRAMKARYTEAGS